MRKPRPTRPQRPVLKRPEVTRVEAVSPALRDILRRPTLPAETFDRLDDLLGELGPRPGRPSTGGFEIPKDFEGPEIKPDLVLQLVDEIDRIDVRPGAGGLDAVSTSILNVIGRTSPDLLPREPLAEGAKGARLPLPDRVLAPLLGRAARELSDGAERVVWDDGVNQLLVEVGAMKADVGDRRVTIVIPVACDQARTEMKIPFATGGEGRNAGMVLATADRPVGDALISRIWGDALIALAHAALMSVVTSLAGASGRDEHNDTLAPRALHAEKGLLRIETGARPRFGMAPK